MYGIFIVFFLLLSLKPLFPGNIFLQLTPFLVLVIGVIRFMFFRKGRIYMPIIRNNFSIYTYLIFIALFIISIVRTNTYDKSMVEIAGDILTVILLNILVYTAVSYQFRIESSFNKNFNKITYDIFIPPAIAIFAILIFYIYGYIFLNNAQYSRGSSVLLNAIGVSFERIDIPFGQGIHPNTYNTNAGIIFTVSLVSLLIVDLRRKLKLILLASLISCFFFILLADSRTVFFNSVGSVLIIYLLLKLNKLQSLKALVIIIPFLSQIFIFFLLSVSDAEILETISRGDNDLESGNSRAIIWTYCNVEVMDPKPKHFVGYGESGHSGAGVSKKYAFIFGDRYDNDNIITHNSMYQTFFDIGYVGIIIYLIVLYNLIADAIFLYKKGYKIVIIFAACFVYYNLSGITGSYFGYYNKMYFNLFMIFTLTLFLFKNEYLKHTTSLNRN